MPRSEALLRQWGLYDNRELAEAFKETLELLEHLEGADRRDAQRLLGMASQRQQQYTQARLWLRRSCQGSSDAQDWLNLALVAAALGDWEQADASFDQVRLIQRIERYAQEPGYYHQLFWYAGALCNAGAHTRALPVLDELAKAYQRVKTADTSQLYVLRLPFLSSFLALVERSFRDAKEYEGGVRWLRTLNEGLDRQGRKQANETMAHLREAGGLAPAEEQ
jgi:tetratricopeptide (TPR) repeat protein